MCLSFQTLPADLFIHSLKINFMSTIKFTAYQEGLSLSLEFAVGTKKSGNIKSKIAGSICNQLFSWVEVQKICHAEGLKLSKPINLKFDVSGMKFDTGTVRKELIQKLILRNNPAGRKNYAKRFNAIFLWATAEIKTVTIEQLFADLDKEIAADNKLKVAA